MAYNESREDITTEIKERADIVQVIGEHVTLKRSGVRYIGLCPFHPEKTPSFSVHAGQQFYHCFGCKESGDVFSFMMKYHNLDFPGALKALAQRYNIELPERRKSHQELEQEKRRSQLFDINKTAANRYRQYLLESPKAGSARAYLKQRGIGLDLQEHYSIGYAPSPQEAGWDFLGSQFSDQERALAIEVGLLGDKQKGGTYDRFRNRIMFPIFDARGRVAGFGGRILGNENPKYLNSPESPVYNKSKLLFGLFQQRQAIQKKRRAVLVEGNFDLLSLIAHGFDSVVAPLGTALTRAQIRILKPLADEVVLLFDGDQAGVKAAERAVGFFLAEQVSGRVALLPQEHDPDTFVRQRGLEELNSLIENSESLPEFVLDQLVNRYGLSLDGKGRIIEELQPLMSVAASSLQRSVWAAHFAKILGIDPQVFLEQLQRSPTMQEGEEHKHMRAHGYRDSKPLKPLNGALKSILTFVILHPHYFQKIEKERLEKAFSETIGEVILLQLSALHAEKKGNLYPEDLLTALPDGEERKLVASLLLDASREAGTDHTSNEEASELEEISSWLYRFDLKKKSDMLLSRICEAQKANDISHLSDLLRLKQELDSELKNG